MTPHQFWHETTPLQFSHFCKQHRIKIYLEDFQVAALHTSFRGVHRQKGGPKPLLSDLLGESPINHKTETLDPAKIKQAFERLFPRKKITDKELVEKIKSERNID